MDTLHTPGRMTFKADGEANQYSMLCDTGRWWLALLHNGEAVSARQVENMRRLAACWNACDGIPTETLEAMGAGTFHRSRDALELASSVFDRIAQGEPFNDVCEETGCTAIVLAAVHGDDAADGFGWRRSYETRADAEGWGIFNEGEIQRDDEADAFASDADAISFVRSCARRGSTLHAAALRRCGLPLEG